MNSPRHIKYNVYYDDDADNFRNLVDHKTKNIIEKNIDKLIDYPYPGRGIGDKERLFIDGVLMYRLHIGRTWTAMYDINEKNKEIRILEIISIDEAHKRYGF